MSTPPPPVPDPRFRKGDVLRDGATILRRDGSGRWLTPWDLWVLSDQHVADPYPDFPSGSSDR